MSDKKMSKKARQRLLEQNTEQLFHLIKTNWTDEKVIEFLNENEVLSDAVDEMQNTALILAANRGYTDTVKLLIERGFDVNARNFWYIVPLLYPTRDKKHTLCEYLFEAGAKPQLINETLKIDEKEPKPAYYAVLLSHSLEMLTLYMRYFKRTDDFTQLNEALNFALEEREKMGDERYEHFDLMFRDDFLDKAKIMIEATRLNFDLQQKLKEKEAVKQKKI